MPVSDRRAPFKTRKFTVLETFRHNRRVYEEGTTWKPRRGVPRHRVDKLWRDGKIGTLDGDACTAVKAEPTEPQKEELTEVQLKALESLVDANTPTESDEEETSDEESDEEETSDEDEEEEQEEA